jgi:hypothetical protein
MKKLFYILSVAILTSCYQNRKPSLDKVEHCIVDSVYKREKSTIEIDDDYILYTKYGKIVSSKEFKKGDTIKIYK